MSEKKWYNEEPTFGGTSIGRMYIEKAKEFLAEQERLEFEKKQQNEKKKCVICDHECVNGVVCSKKCWMEMGGISGSPPNFDDSNKYFK